MKKLGLIIAGALVCSAGIMAAVAGEKVITTTQLPQKAQTFIKKHYSGTQVALVKEDKEIISTDYEVIFADGSKVEFNASGDWKDVTSLTEVPAAVVPQEIATFIATNNYNANGVKIVKIDRDRSGYDVELSNGLELEFNPQFQLVDIDD